MTWQWITDDDASLKISNFAEFADKTMTAMKESNAAEATATMRDLQNEPVRIVSIANIGSTFVLCVIDLVPEVNLAWAVYEEDSDGE